MKRDGPAATAAGFALVAALLIPSRAAGAPLDGTTEGVAAAESRLALVERIYSRPDETAPERARRQFDEGEIQFARGDWLYASVLMYGALDEAEFQASAAAPRALLVLGDALRKQGSSRAALGAYEELLRRGAGPMEVPALTGALACRISLGQLDGIEPLLQAARALLKDGRPAELAYLVGKATALRTDLGPAERLEQGLAAFAEVAPPYHLAARYFQGSLLLDAGQLEAAAGRFEACLALEGAEPAQVEVRELCAMAAGRVRAEQGRFAESLDRYQLVPYTSTRFDEALYEVAWGSLRAGRLDHARRTATLIVDLEPGSRLAPEATILTGHIDRRLGRFAQASLAFQQVVATYGPVRDEVDALLTTHGDPVSYLGELIARQGPAFDAASVLPPIAARWAKDQPDLGRGLDLAGDIDGARQDLADSGHVLERIERVLQRSGGLDAVPLARDGWINADAVENDTAWLRGQLADRAAELAGPRLSPEQRGELERQRAARRELQPRLDSLPRTMDEVEARAARMKARVDHSGRAIFQLEQQTDAAEAAVGGAEVWLNQHRAELERDPDGLAELVAQLRAQRAAVAGYRQELRTLRQALSEVRDAAVGTAQAAGDGGLRAEYLALLERERALLRPARPALAPAEADELARAEALAGRLDLADAGAERLKAQFAGVGRLHAVEVNRRIAAERASLQLQQEQLASVSGDAGNLVGRIALRSFAAVRAQLHRLVLKADVGLLDAAWSQKRERVESIQLLSQQKDAALQALDRDLRQVLREVE